MPNILQRDVLKTTKKCDFNYSAINDCICPRQVETDVAKKFFLGGASTKFRKISTNILLCELYWKADRYNMRYAVLPAVLVKD